MKININHFKHGKNLKIIGKNNVYIDNSVTIGDNVTIYSNNLIEGNSFIGDNCILYPGNHITSSKLQNNVMIESSNIKECEISSFATVGPFARIRPNSIIEENCKIGNFVEIKNSTIGKNTKISHLTYVGDCQIGKNCNIGCGVIFVNYNGISKNKTIVGNNCFIGSNVNIIAPVVIADNSYICAGTTLTKNTNKNDFIIGRVDNVTKDNYASLYLAKKQKK